MTIVAPANLAFVCVTLIALFGVPAGQLKAASPNSKHPIQEKRGKAQPSQTPGTMVWLSDIHFDPLYPANPQHDPVDSNVQALLQALSKPSGPNATRWRDHTEWQAIFQRKSKGKFTFPQQSKNYNVDGTDPNDKLMQAVLDRIGSSSTHADFVLITGDFLGHNLVQNYFANAPPSLQTTQGYNAFVRETMAYIAMSVSQQFQNIPIFAALGNNDAYCDDYGIRLQSGFLADTAATFQKYFLASLPANEQGRIKRSFLTGGFFEAGIPKTPNRIVMLNSVPFMTKYPQKSWTDQVVQECGSLPKVDVVDEFERLERTIGSLPDGSRAWITCHVPPGINCYDGSNFWDPTVLDEFRKLYLDAKHLPKMAGVLGAHTHLSEFKLIRTGTETVGPTRSKAVSFVLLNSSVTRNHRNNPGFRLMTYERDSLRIISYTTHYLDFVASSTSPPWKSLSFKGSYGHDEVTADTLDEVYQRMVKQQPGPNGTNLRVQYSRNYDVRADSSGESDVISKWDTTFQKGIGSLTGN